MTDDKRSLTLTPEQQKERERLLRELDYIRLRFLEYALRHGMCDQAVALIDDEQADLPDIDELMADGAKALSEVYALLTSLSDRQLRLWD